MKLLYIMDPLCGWCYGNSANILKIEKEFSTRLEIEVLPGGMWTGDSARYQSGELAEIIRPADARLRALTGVEMTEAYDQLLTDSSVLLDSKPGCRAINTVKEMDASLTLTFASAIACVRYVDGVDNTLLSTFLRVVEKLGIDGERFREIYESPKMKALTEATFVRASKYAHSYPSMFLTIGENNIPLSLMNYDYLSQKSEIERYL